MSLLTSPTPFGGAAVRRRAPPASAAAATRLDLPLVGSRAALHVARARRGGVSSRTQRRLEERGKNKRRGGGSVTAPAPPDMDEDAAAGEGVDWEGEPLGFEVSTTPMPELPDPEKPDFWEGPQWDALGFFVQYMWAFGVFFGLVACGFAVATYNEGATDFRETPSYKESVQTQEFPEESESSGSDVFEGNPTEVAPALE
ncbi:uncharacterized LOC4333878 [Oryza sativa Japonica Group]|jgi:hypothetical protein|uniref:Expressed protein n=8 Tax=Oryza TaxID=4527 RepID=Q53RJ7_ORYSJ|nr:uncharacterized LOC4333878 [Oryza sativa Japonica Group]EAY91601.1 hypothetical protein OsI_13236 [Oryza sativa Indica Group]KAB8093238.1 hypothetical protein EE612_019980 [Oryza sativa]AAX95658.1 hypothetical protein [Oryza sativa Japonica Group]ABF98503.1 expressed protein [Oryza sativa Japonica Group]KAF2940940.1 hypothetical protein DAI22_03g310900 [Oryza sativa Japonica Group]|eukprot:NP_001051049.1 Os03g0710600 [Oryza sativa Japonica Group]